MASSHGPSPDDSLAGDHQPTPCGSGIHGGVGQALAVPAVPLRVVGGDRAFQVGAGGVGGYGGRAVREGAGPSYSLEREAEAAGEGPEPGGFDHDVIALDPRFQREAVEQLEQDLYNMGRVRAAAGLRGRAGGGSHDKAGEFHRLIAGQERHLPGAREAGELAVEHEAAGGRPGDGAQVGGYGGSSRVGARIAVEDRQVPGVGVVAVRLAARF